MIRNYFKIAWRNIKEYKFYSLINIFGLVTGLTFTFLIGAYVWGELHVNGDLKNESQQYLLMSDWKDASMGIDFTTLAPLAKNLKEEYPHLVANYYRWDGITSIASKGDLKFRENLQIGDNTLLSMYGFKLLYGDSKTALKDPYSVVISSKRAIAYFGKTDVIGEIISIQNFSGKKGDFKITGVLKELSNNSVTRIYGNKHNTFFIPTNTATFFERDHFDSWLNIFTPSYIELQKGVSVKDLEIPLQTLIARNTPEHIHANLKVNTVPLTNYYLEKDNGLVKRMLYTLSFLGLFVLLMALVNFINITISASSNRIKEIGIRKTLGGLKKQLIFQFLIESFLIVLFATCFALIGFVFLRDAFGALLNAQIPKLTSFPSYYILVLISITMLISLLSGLYPAFILSSFKPIASLKGKLKISKKHNLFRKVLVGFQFSIALIVLISATFITLQINYFFEKDLGYNKDCMLSVQVPRDWSEDGVRKMEVLRNEFEKMAQVSKASLSFEIPDGRFGHKESIHKIESEKIEAINLSGLTVDDHFFDTYEIPLIAGTNFNNSVKGVSSKVILNEKAVSMLGYKNATEAIGQKLKISDGQNIYTIEGVTKNFHFGSLHQEVEPLLFSNVLNVTIYRYLSFRISPENISNSIQEIQKRWSELIPDSTFEYTFMDETLEHLYTSELQLKKATYYTSFLALIIVFLGVIGLVVLNIHKRIKEIGVRKILGASSLKIATLFVKEFIPIIGISSIVACSVSYLMMQDWLNNYVYHIAITSKPFIITIVTLAGVISILIAFLTLKIASKNLIKSLRTE